MYKLSNSTLCALNKYDEMQIDGSNGDKHNSLVDFIEDKDILDLISDRITGVKSPTTV